VRRYLRRDPHDPALHYRLAAVLFEAGKTEEGRKEALEARRLDELARPPRKLSDRQQEQVAAWLGKDSAK